MSRVWRGAGIAIVLTVASFLGGCASGSANRGETRRERNFLTSAELDAAGYTDAFSAVQALRPQWLRTRGTTSINQPETIKVYLDGSRLGGPEQLRGIAIQSISSIRFLDGLEATARWGLDHGQGAIVVSTRGKGL